MTIRCVFGSPNGLNNAWLKMSIFTEKSSFLTKLIFTSMTMWTSRIVVFGGQRIRTSSVEKPMHNEWLFGGIIGPFFFENELGVAVTVNGERYRATLNEFSLPKFEEEDTDDIWFQQDGASSQRYNRSFAHFENRIIYRPDVNWPPRNCDLIVPLDYFLWGTVKNECYVNQKRFKN